MKLNKANGRDKKRQKRKHGMRVDGRSVKVIQSIIIKKGSKKGATK